MQVVSIREHPELAQDAVRYFQQKWATEQSLMVYEDAILNTLHAAAPLPQWYLLCDGTRIIGCAGLITNDFISRGDLYPWLCALYIEPECRGNAYGALLIRRAKEDAGGMGYRYLYLCTHHVGYYERYGFSYLADGYHPWGERSRIYRGETGVGGDAGRPL